MRHALRPIRSAAAAFALLGATGGDVLAHAGHGAAGAAHAHASEAWGLAVLAVLALLAAALACARRK